MPDRKIHIISFDIPDPPNYGGVIDVFYKIVHLHRMGIGVILHCFEYGRPHSDFLESVCDRVYYYPRRTGVTSQCSIIPYIVKSRRSSELSERLQQDNYPVLFEGLHTCYLIDHPAMRQRLKIYRESNIEHHYYFHLFKAEKNPVRKLFFLLESLRLKHFEKILTHSDLMLAVSEKDHEYLADRFPGKNVKYLPSFHQNDELSVKPGKGDYVLYHGNLEVAENVQAAIWLIQQVFSKSRHKVIIAGKNPDQKLKKLVSRYPNIRLTANPGQASMDTLVKNAHIHVLITFQATGLKLKLLNTLYQGRFCLVNTKMLAGTGLDDLCHIADDAEKLILNINRLMNREFGTEEIEKRQAILYARYSNDSNIKEAVLSFFGKD